MISLIGKKNKNYICDEFYSKYKTCLYLHSFEGSHTFFECDIKGKEYYDCLSFIKNKKNFLNKNINNNKKHESK